MTKQRLRIALFLAAVLCRQVVVCGQDTSTATDIAARLRGSLEWQQAFSTRVRAAFTPLEGFSDKGLYAREFAFRYDANTMQAEWIGQLVAAGASDNDPCIIIDFKKVMTAPHSLEVESPNGVSPLVATMTENYKDRLQAILDSDGYGGPLLGRIFGNGHMNVAELLNRADDLTMRPDQEDVKGLRCYILKGTTRFGEVTAWVAPDKGYSPVKWVIQKTGNDLFDDKPVEGDLWVADFEVIEFEQHGPVFVPKRAAFKLTMQLPDGSKEVGRYSYEVSEIELNPDFAALGAFKISLPEGTRVFLEEEPGVRYVWWKGKVVPDVDGTKRKKIDPNLIESMSRCSD